MDNHHTLVSNIEQNLRRPFCDKVESQNGPQEKPRKYDMYVV